MGRELPNLPYNQALEEMHQYTMKSRLEPVDSMPDGGASIPACGEEEVFVYLALYFCRLGSALPFDATVVVGEYSSCVCYVTVGSR